MIKIRTASIRDAEGIINFLKELKKEGCNTISNFQIPLKSKEIKYLQSKKGKNGVFFIAKDCNKVIGTIDAARQRPDELGHNCEFGMAVLKPYRKKGIGTRLIKMVLTWARKNRFKRVELNVGSINMNAIRLYRNLGFIKDGCRKKAVKLRNGRFCDLIHMAKTL
jgi:RimJ/RimL family protein N-acetyltransferase